MNGEKYSPMIPNRQTAAEMYSRALNLLADASALRSAADRSDAWLADFRHSRQRVKMLMLLLIIVIVILGGLFRRLGG